MARNETHAYQCLAARVQANDPRVKVCASVTDAERCEKQLRAIGLQCERRGNVVTIH